jgi:mannosyltransferase
MVKHCKLTFVFLRMINFDYIIGSSKNNSGGVNVYFKELIQRTAQVLDVNVIIYNSLISQSDLNINISQCEFRSQRILERYRSIKDLKSGLLHTSYYRTTKQQNVKNIITVYDFIYEKFYKDIKTNLHSIQKRAAINNADEIICISNSTKNDLIKYFPECPLEKIHVTHLAAGSDYKPLLNNTDLASNSVDYVLFVGGRGGYKNFGLVIESLKQLKGISLICAGGGEFTNQEIRLLENSIKGRYYNAGHISTKKLNELYNSALCLVYPSLYEGFGIPIVEAMQAGCPFVALNNSSISEVAGNAGVLLEKSDSYLLLMALKNCMKSQFRDEIINEGFERAKNFSWEKNFLQTYDIYNNLLK